MPRRYRRAPRRRTTSRRRPRRTSRRRGGLRVRPDGIVKEKITFVHQMANMDASNGYLNLHWNDPAGAGGSSFNVGAGTNQFQYKDMLRNYQFYYIYGLGIKFAPRIFGQDTNNTSTITQVQCASFKSDTATIPTDTDLINAKDFKMYSPGQVFSRYYRIGKYLKGLKYGWIEHDGVIDGPARMKTSILVRGTNFGLPTALKLGDVQITYYVAFKSRRHS